jgi:hypothetical protein
MPYTENAIAPIRLMSLSLNAEFIKRETATRILAEYPIIE